MEQSFGIKCWEGMPKADRDASNENEKEAKIKLARTQHVPPSLPPRHSHAAPLLVGRGAPKNASASRLRKNAKHPLHPGEAACGRMCRANAGGRGISCATGQAWKTRQAQGSENSSLHAFIGICRAALKFQSLERHLQTFFPHRSRQAKGMVECVRATRLSHGLAFARKIFSCFACLWRGWPSIVVACCN